MKKIFCYLLLLVLPLLMVQTTLYLNKAKGPYWVGSNYDPEYTFLFNALNVAQMKGARYSDSPGTSVISMEAIVLRAMHLLNFSTKDDLQTDVLKNPEFYLAVINKVFLVLNTLMLILLGIVTLWLTKNVMMSIIIQSSPFFSISTFIDGLSGAKAESFLLLSSLLFVFLIIIYAYKDTERIRNCISNTGYLRKLSLYSFFTICFSVVSGFGMASKVTFMPLLVVPLIILPSYKNKIMYILGTSLSFVFFTLPIIKEYGRLFGWLFSIISHSRIYGAGEGKLFEPSLYLSNVKYILTHNTFFTVVLSFSLFILLVSYIVPMFRKLSSGNINFRLLLGVSLSQLLGVIIVGKHYAGSGSDRYLLSFIGFSGLTIMLAILYLRQVRNEIAIDVTKGLIMQKTRYVISKLKIKLLLFIIIPFLFIARTNAIREYFSVQSRVTNQHLAVYNKVENDYREHIKIYYWGSSSPAYASYWGCINGRVRFEELQKYYQNVYFYDFLHGKYYDWNNEVHFEEIVSKHGEKIIFQGLTFDKIVSLFNAMGFDVKRPDLQLIDVFKGNDEGFLRETIYEIDFPSK